MPHPLYETVRERFRYACGYCGVTEITVGGELTLDHYRPQAAGGADSLENLVYACIRCNQYKGDFWPDADDLTLGRRVLHPGVDDVSAHLIEDKATGQLRGLTQTGAFHIALLRLNRSQLISHRLARHLLLILSEKVHLLEQQNVELEKTIAAQERYLELLRSRPIRGD